MSQDFVQDFVLLVSLLVCEYIHTNTIFIFIFNGSYYEDEHTSPYRCHLYGINDD